MLKLKLPVLSDCYTDRNLSWVSTENEVPDWIKICMLFVFDVLLLEVASPCKFIANVLRFISPPPPR